MAKTKIAKLTSKNQLTLPAAIVRDFPGVDYFEVREVESGILLEPIRGSKATDPEATLRELQAHVARLGIIEGDVADAVQWARKQRR